MSQTLSLNVTIPVEIPEDKVLVDKKDLEQLRAENLIGRTWKVRDVAERLQRPRQWVYNEILNNPRFKTDINQLMIKGVVSRGNGPTSPWIFKANDFAKWLDQNWIRFDWKRGY